MKIRNAKNKKDVIFIVNGIVLWELGIIELILGLISLGRQE